MKKINIRNYFSKLISVNIFGKKLLGVRAKCYFFVGVGVEFGSLTRLLNFLTNSATPFKAGMPCFTK